jgi:hypothetical protein
MKTLLIAIAGMAAISAPASAAPIVGSFSLTSFSGTYIGGTAATATGLDFGTAFASTGNGYGLNGSALIGNATGNFAGLNGLTASIADIALGATANPYTVNPFISFGSASNIVFNFSNAVLTRSPLGTSVSIAGQGTFSNGNAADTTTGMFSLATASQNGMASNANFTFTSNVSAVAGAVPEPATWALMILGMGAVGFAMRRRNTTTRVRFA